MRVDRPIALWLLVAVLAAAGWISAPASASQGKMRRPPALLWKSYPLEPGPTVTEQPQPPSNSRPPPPQPQPRVKSKPPPLAQWQSSIEQAQPRLVSAQPGERLSPQSSQLRNVLLVSALLVLLAAMTVIALRRRSVPRPEPARPAPAAEQSSWAPQRPPPAEISREPVRKPRAAPSMPVVAAPADDLPAAPRTAQPALQVEQRTLAEAVLAAPRTEPRAFESHPAREAPQPGPRVERCEIRLWRGYVKCQFYATAPGSEEALAASRHFRLRDDEAPNAGARSALAELVAELEQQGWTVAPDNASWYQHRLERIAA